MDNLPFLSRGVDPTCKRIFNPSTNTATKSVEKPFTEEEVRKTLQRFDANKDGRLSKQELKNALNSLGSRCPGFRAFLALHHADKNGNGFIDEEEMEKLVQYICKREYKIK